MWDKKAKCRDEDPELFFPAGEEVDRKASPVVESKNEIAKAICRQCPVVIECLEYNIDARHGVFGGLDRMERKHLKRLGINPRDAKQYIYGASVLNVKPAPRAQKTS